MSKTGYKRLGDYIREMDVRNRDLKVTKLLGLSMTKQFRPSTSNIVGVDLSKYKVVDKNVFAFDPMSVIRVHKVPIALNTDNSPIIVSPAYTTFKSIDENILDSRYLMMWFNRTEFDRYADFKSDAAVRGGYNWDALCDTLIILPSIDKQRKIVAEYYAIQQRIKLNEQLIVKLEETAQAIYHKMFVDGIDKNNLPEGWRIGTLGEIADFKNGKTVKANDGIIPIYGGNGIVGYTEHSNAKNVIVIGRVGINCGNALLELNKCWVNDNAMIAISRSDCIYFLYWLIRGMDLNSQSEGSSQPLLTQVILNQQECLIPSYIAIKRFDNQSKILVKIVFLLQNKITKLIELQSLLLARMGQ